MNQKKPANVAALSGATAAPAGHLVDELKQAISTAGQDVLDACGGMDPAGAALKVGTLYGLLVAKHICLGEAAPRAIINADADIEWVGAQMQAASSGPRSVPRDR